MWMHGPNRSPGLCEVALVAQLKARHGACGVAAVPGDIQGDALECALGLDGGLCGRARVVMPGAAVWRHILRRGSYTDP